MIKTWQQRCEEHPDHEGIVTEQMIRERMQEEIDELRQALAESANSTTDFVESKAPVQPEQEPVAWMGVDSYGNVTKFRTNEFGGGIPLYTAPPISDYHEGWEEGFKAAKKEWVGLTDDERSYYLQSAANVGWWQAALFVEAKLKEKNT